MDICMAYHLNGVFCAFEENYGLVLSTHIDHKCKVYLLKKQINVKSDILQIAQFQRLLFCFLRIEVPVCCLKWIFKELLLAAVWPQALHM